MHFFIFDILLAWTRRFSIVEHQFVAEDGDIVLAHVVIQDRFLRFMGSNENDMRVSRYY